MPMITTGRRVAPMAGLLLLAACAAPAGAPSASATEAAASRPPFETVAPSPSDDPAAGAPDGLPEAAWTAILDDLSRRLGERVVDPTVISGVAKTWNDGSLGCPQPGQLYTQALVEGFQVVLEVDGEQFDYRVGSGTDVRLCEG
jgi:hypothetical protein